MINKKQLQHMENCKSVSCCISLSPAGKSPKYRMIYKLTVCAGANALTAEAIARIAQVVFMVAIVV